MHKLDRLIAVSRVVARIRHLERKPSGTAVPELQKLLQDPASREVIVPLLLALRHFGPAAAVVLPLVEKLTRPEEAAKIRKVAKTVLASIRGK